MRKSTSINLELIKGEDGGVKFYAKQFDDLKLNIKIYDGLEEVNIDGQDIIVCIIKEDKTVIEQTKDIIVEDNTIIARLSKQATTALGKCSMEVLLRDEEGTASTTTISYLVNEKLSASIVEMIKSEDDINALNLIEEFIETSNVDMLDIKEAIKDLKATVDGAQDSIDAEYETILEALRALEGTIIENIEGKANEALTIADEAVEKATGAITKADEVLVKVEEVKGVVGEISTEKDNALQAIESTKTGATDEIDTVKGRAINDIDEARTDSLETIRNNGNGVANDLNTLSDTLKADIANTGLLETNKVIRAREEAINTIDDLKDNVLGSLGEEALKVEEILNATVTEIKEQAKTDLNACKDEVIEEAVKGKEEAIKELNDASNTLNNLKATILNDINTNKEEAISNIGTNKDGAINELNEVKAGALVDINNLKNEVDTLLNSLNEKVVESNGNIQELAGLIEEAREVAGLVRAFIDSKAVDLSNYYTREETNTLIDEKIGLIEIPEVDLSNYYTKIETDEKLKKVNEFKGMIGASVKVATPPVGMFDDLPDIPDLGEGTEYIGKWMYSYPYSSSTIKYVVCYIYNNHNDSKYPYLYVDAKNTSDTMFRTANLSGPYKTMSAFERSSTTGSWSAVNSISTFYPQRKTYNLYHCDLPIYSDIDKTGIYQEATIGEFISNLNNANEAGNYLFKVNKNEYKELINAPKNDLKNDIDTVLKCYKKDSSVYQEVVINGTTYTRKIGDEWTSQDTSDFIKKDAIAEIKAGESIASIPDFYSSCPIPNISARIIGEIDFKADIDKYYRIYVIKDKENEMFYKYDNGVNCYMGFTASSQYVIKYVYSGGVWTLEDDNYAYARGKVAEIEIYRNTLPICKGTGASAYDKTTILYEVNNGDSETIINDFNNAITSGIYKVDIKAGDVIASSPFSVNTDEGVALIPELDKELNEELDMSFKAVMLSTQDIKGILEVVKAKDIIKQELTTTDNIVYKRIFNGTSWSSWRKEITEDDLVQIFRELSETVTLD